MKQTAIIRTNSNTALSIRTRPKETLEAPKLSANTSGDFKPFW